MVNKKYDWDIVKEYWLCSGESLKSITSKYGIPYQTVRRHAAQRKWTSDWCYVRVMRDLYPDEKDMLLPFADEKERKDYLNATNARKC